ncbi:MAG TPA: hypothetical protein VFH66_09365 [Mycobacteriales bacterium]|nr:hypothetical protein [Mycobacteriales bacterium]
MASLDSAFGSAAAWAAAGVGAYLVLGLVAAFTAQQARRPRPWADRLLLLYPRLLRTMLRTLAAGTLGIAAAGIPSPALAASPGDAGHPRPPLVAPERPAAEPFDWPSPDATPPPSTLRRPPSAPYVTVRHGDCLWSLAARSLGRGATPAAVAAAWPRWWAANRSVVGTDPDALRPGERLRVPSAPEAASATERSAS